VTHTLKDGSIKQVDLLPERRNAAGTAQGKLAVDMVRAFMGRELETRGERAALKLLERVAAIAAESGAVRVFLLLWDRSARRRCGAGFQDHDGSAYEALAADHIGGQRST
jgi:hypothetical protein